MKISHYYIFLYIILSLQTYSIISLFPLKYPYSLYLSDGNLFVIHDKGISIYDHLFTKKLKDVFIFSEKDQIDPSDISRITTAFEDEYIFSIIKDKIYIFDDKANLLYHNETSILNEGIFPSYYSLVIFKSETNLYKYFISYFYNRNRYQIIFEYSITLNKNNLISFYHSERFSYSYGNNNEFHNIEFFYDDNNALSCQYMIDKNKN